MGRKPFSASKSVGGDFEARVGVCNGDDVGGGPTGFACEGAKDLFERGEDDVRDKGAGGECVDDAGVHGAQFARARNLFERRF